MKNPTYDSKEPLLFNVGDRVKAFDPLLYVDDETTPVEITMKPAEVLKSYHDENGLAMADIKFGHDGRVSLMHYQAFMVSDVSMSPED